MKFVAVLLAFVSVSVALQGIPEVWNVAGKAPDTHMLRVTFAVKHRDSNLLHGLFEDISLPTGKNFRNFLSLKELGDLVGPTRETVETISAYLSKINADHVTWTPGKDFVKFHISVKDATKHFRTDFLRYRHLTSKRILVRAESEVFLPIAVQRSVDVTTGLQDFFGNFRYSNKQENQVF